MATTDAVCAQLMDMAASITNMRTMALAGVDINQIQKASAESIVATIGRVPVFDSSSIKKVTDTLASHAGTYGSHAKAIADASQSNKFQKGMPVWTPSSNE